MTDSDVRGEFRAHAFKAWSSRFARCLAPGNLCEQEAIAAHSIQRLGPIALLATAGHVYMLDAPINLDRPPIASFRLFGLGKASVFKGLCAHHDNTLFAPIEKEDFNPNNREQLRLHAYRAVLQETHASIETAVRLQSSYLKACNLGMSDPNNPGPGAMSVTHRLAATYETWMYKEECDRVMSTPPSFDFEHDVLFFPGTGPRIAVSALFSLDNLIVGNDIARAAITVFPTEAGDTYAILSYLPRDAAMVRAELTELLASHGSTQQYFLSRLIIERCQNVAFAPAIVDAMASLQRSIISEFYNATTLYNDPDFQSPFLNLF